jgi:hypothetical protein
MSAPLFELNLSPGELERELNRMFARFDQLRKRVTGQHQVRPLPLSPDTDPPGTLRATLLPGMEDNRQDRSKDDTVAEVAISGERRSSWQCPFSGQTFSIPETVSAHGTLQYRPRVAAALPSERENWSDAIGSSLEPSGPATVHLPLAVSPTIDIPHPPSMSEETLREWLQQLQWKIDRGDLSAVLEAVYWANPVSHTPHTIRLELVRTLYSKVRQAEEVRHLALRLSLVAHEPFEPIRRLSLDFLIRSLRVFGWQAQSVLSTLQQAADACQEPQESVRLIALRFLCQIMGSSSDLRQWLYQIVWLRREPSLMCRMILLEHILLWIQEPPASERERFEGLYLLQRTLEDEQESHHVRFSLASQILDSRFGLFPADVHLYLRRKIFPLCRRLLGRENGAAERVAERPALSSSTRTFPES